VRHSKQVKVSEWLRRGIASPVSSPSKDVFFFLECGRFSLEARSLILNIKINREAKCQNLYKARWRVKKQGSDGVESKCTSPGQKCVSTHAKPKPATKVKQQKNGVGAQTQTKHINSHLCSEEVPPLHKKGHMHWVYRQCANCSQHIENRKHEQRRLILSAPTCEIHTII